MRRVGLARVAIGSVLAADDVGVTFARGFAPPGVAGVNAFAESARATMSFMVRVCFLRIGTKKIVWEKPAQCYPMATVFPAATANETPRPHSE